MRHHCGFSGFSILIMIGFLTSGCGSALQPTATPTVLPATATPAPPKVLQYGLPAGLSAQNPWAIFGSSGTVWDAVQTQSLWPRLFVSENGKQDLIPLVAKGYNDTFVQEDSIWTIQIELAGGKWTDGSAVTSDDVAYTATTILKAGFGLGFREAFNPLLLKSVEAVNPLIVKYTFIQKPDSQTWRRILTAPILNKTYWEPKTTPILSVDSSADLQKIQDQITQSNQAIEEKQSRISQQQSELDRLVKERASVKLGIQNIQDMLNAKKAKDAETVVVNTRKLKDLTNLFSLYNFMIKEKTNALQGVQGEIYQLTSEKAAAILSAAELSAKMANTIASLPADGEPHFGPWTVDKWSLGSGLTLNYAPDADWKETIFGKANPKGYDTVKFDLSEVGQTAAQLTGNQLNAALQTASLGPIEGAKGDPTGLTSQVYLQFSGNQPVFSLPAVRKAVACMLDDTQIAGNLLGNQAAAASQSKGLETLNPCSGKDDSSRLDTAAQMLRGAGFTWGSDSQSASGTASTAPSYIGIIGPDGKVVIPLTLVYPSGAYGADRAKAAQYLSAQMIELGFGIQTQEMALPDLLKMLADGKGYDMVLNAWTGQTDDLSGWCAAVGYGNQSVGGGIVDSQYTESCVQPEDMTPFFATMASELTILPLYQADILIYTSPNADAAVPVLNQSNSGLVGSANAILWGINFN